MDPEQLRQLLAQMDATRVAPPPFDPDPNSVVRPGELAQPPSRARTILGGIRDVFDPTQGKGIFGFGADVLRDIQRNPIEALTVVGDVEANLTGQELSREGHPFLGGGLQLLGAGSAATSAIPLVGAAMGSLARQGARAGARKLAEEGAEATLRARHFGPQVEDLDALSPSAHGTGLRGAELQRQAAFPDEFVDRTYFYAGDTPPEPGLAGKPSVEVDLPAGRIATPEQQQPFVEEAQRQLAAEGKPVVSDLVTSRAERLLSESDEFDGFLNPQAGVIVKFNDTELPRGAANRQIIAATDEFDGATFSTDGENLAGEPLYATARPTPDGRKDWMTLPEGEELTAEHLNTFRSRFADELSDPDASIGTWHDRATGRTALDVVETISDRDEALRRGAERGQDAIFDLGTMEEIKVNRRRPPSRPATGGGGHSGPPVLRSAAARIGDRVFEGSGAHPTVVGEIEKAGFMQDASGGVRDGSIPLDDPASKVEFPEFGYADHDGNFVTLDEAFERHGLDSSEELREAGVLGALDTEADEVFKGAERRAAVGLDRRAQERATTLGRRVSDDPVTLLRRQLQAEETAQAASQAVPDPDELFGPGTQSVEEYLDISPRELQGLEKLPRRQRAVAAADARQARHEATVASRARRQKEIERGLTPEELEKLDGSNRGVQNRVATAYSRLPTPKAFAQAAIRGARARGWYLGSGKTIRGLFGEADAPRATALIAAQSPNKSVEDNLHFSLATWRNWVKAGRPTDAAEIERLSPLMEVPDPQPGNPNRTKWVPTPESIIQSPLPADYQNSIRALSATDEALASGDPSLLSGPKVGPFYANLLGAVSPVTNDTHMARGYGTMPGGVGGVSRTLAQNAMIGNAAREFQRLTGVAVDRREIQEMTWAYIRGLTNAAGTDGKALDVLERSLLDPTTVGAGGRTMAEQVDDAVPMGELLSRPEYAEVIREIGLEPPVSNPPTGVPGVDPLSASPNALRDIAERIDLVREGSPLFGLMLMLQQQQQQRERNR